MSQRTLVPIFVFWAILTIITPTLILLSENSKADLDANGGNAAEGMKARRMVGYTHNHVTITTPPSPAAESVVAEELASAPPAPSPSPSPTWLHLSHHNHTLTSNKTEDDDGLALSSTKMKVKVELTDIR